MPEHSIYQSISEQNSHLCLIFKHYCKITLKRFNYYPLQFTQLSCLTCILIHKDTSIVVSHRPILLSTDNTQKFSQLAKQILILYEPSPLGSSSERALALSDTVDNKIFHPHLNTD